MPKNERILIYGVLNSQWKNIAFRVLDRALEREPEPLWMITQLQTHWPLLKDLLFRRYFANPEYVERLLKVWSPSQAEILELVEYLFENWARHYYPLRQAAPFAEKNEWRVLEADSVLDQLIVMLRCNTFTLLIRMGDPGTDIALGQWGEVSLALPPQKESLPSEVYDINNSLEILLQRSDLIPKVRISLWFLFWRLNKPDGIRVSSFLEDIRQIQQADSLDKKAVRYYGHRLIWPLLALAARRQQDKGPKAVKGLLPFLDAKSQLSISKQVTKVIQRKLQRDEVKGRQTFIILHSKDGLDNHFPELRPLAMKMGVTVSELVEVHIQSEYITKESKQLELTIDELKELLTAARKALKRNKRDVLHNIIWLLGQTTWPSSRRALAQGKRCLNDMLEQSLIFPESTLVSHSIVVFLKLLTHDNLQKTVLKLLMVLSEDEVLDRLSSWIIRGALEDLPEERLAIMEPYLTHEDKSIRRGAVIFWNIIIDATFDYISNTESKTSIRFSPEIGLALAGNSDKIIRLGGIALLTLSELPIEDDHYRQKLIDLLRQPEDVEEEQGLARFLEKTCISDDNCSNWCHFLEAILDEPRSYGNLILSAAMHRYQELNSTADIALSGVEETELGLP